MRVGNGSVAVSFDRPYVSQDARLLEREETDEQRAAREEETMYWSAGH